MEKHPHIRKKKSICPATPLQVGCDTRSIFKQNPAALNSGFASPRLVA